MKNTDPLSHFAMELAFLVRKFELESGQAVSMNVALHKDDTYLNLCYTRDFAQVEEDEEDAAIKEFGFPGMAIGLDSDPALSSNLNAGCKMPGEKENSFKVLFGGKQELSNIILPNKT